MQVIVSQLSYLSVNDRRLQFGLGDSKTADLEIWWPGGAKQAFPKLQANRLYVIREGSRVPEQAPWPGTRSSPLQKGPSDFAGR